MYNAKLMKILDSVDKLSEKLASLLLFKSFLFDDQLEKFTLGDILHHQEELLRCLYDLVELDEVGMSDLFEDVDLACDSFHIGYITYFALLQHFHCNFFTCQRVDAKFDFPKSTLAKVACKDIIADSPSSWQCAFFFLFRHE